MNTTLKQRCDLFIQNRDTIKAEFKWENSYIYPLCASIYTSKNQHANPEQMRYCLDLLKKQTSIFSNFRGTVKMALVTKLAMSPHPEEMLNNVLLIYNNLKQLFFSSEYLASAAAVIAELAPPDSYEALSQRTRSIYNLMKNNHPFLTSGEDSSFAAMLSLSNLEESWIDEEMERCYKILKPNFFSGNAVHSLCQVLVLDNKPAEVKCGKVMDIYNYLKGRGFRYGTNYELATLGVLALLDTNTETIGNSMIDAGNFLETQKGFGLFGIGSKQRLMYAGILTMGEYMPETSAAQTAALNSIISIVIAQQVAMAAAVAASASAASSSSN